MIKFENLNLFSTFPTNDAQPIVRKVENIRVKINGKKHNIIGSLQFTYPDSLLQEQRDADNEFLGMGWVRKNREYIG